jgi:hypothetical protein
MRALAATAAVAALLVVPAAHGSSPAVLYVAPNGDDGGACTRTAPCASFDRAYHAAQPGATVLVAPGTYPAQELSADPTKTSRLDVVIRPVPGRGRVLVDGRLSFTGVHHLTMSRIDVGRSDPYWDLLFQPCNADVTLADVGGGRYLGITGGNSDITLLGGDWGDYGAPGEHDSAIGGAGDPGDTCDGAPVQPIRNLVLEGVTFHDSFWGETPEQWGGAHPDCLEIDGDVASMTIRDSSFLRCGDSFIGLYGDLGGPTENVTIERSRFVDGATYGYWGIQMTDDGHPYHCSGIVFRNNLYHPNSTTAPQPYTPIRTTCSGAVPTRVIGNVFQAGPNDFGCSVFTSAPFDTVWDRNLFEYADPCGTHALGPFVKR